MVGATRMGTNNQDKQTVGQDHVPHRLELMSVSDT